MVTVDMSFNWRKVLGVDGPRELDEGVLAPLFTELGSLPPQGANRSRHLYLGQVLFLNLVV